MPTPVRAMSSAHTPPRGFLLRLESQHYDSGVLFGRVRLNIGEVQIKSQQNPVFAPCSGREYLVISAREILLPNSLHIKTKLT